MNARFSYYDWLAQTVSYLDIQGSSSEALYQAREFVDAFPGYEYSEVYLADLLTFANKASEAIDRISRASLRDHHSPLFKASEISIHLAIGNKDMAKAKWEHAIKTMVNKDLLLFSVISRAAALGHVDFINMILESLPTDNLKIDTVKSVHGFVASFRGDFVSASNCLDAVGLHHEEISDLYFLARAWTHVKRKAIQDARLYTEAVVGNIIEDNLILRPIVSQFLRDFSFSLAQSHSTSKLRSLSIIMQWNYVDELKKVIPQLLGLGLLRQAFFQAARLRQAAPSDREALILFAQVSLALGGANEAIEILHTLSDSARSAHQVLSLETEALIAMKKYDELLELLRTPQAEELRKSPEIFPILDDLVNLGHAESVFYLLESIKHAAEKDPLAYTSLSIRIFSRLGHLNIVDQLIDQADPVTRSYLRLVSSEMSAGGISSEQARQSIAEVLTRCPNDLKLLMGVAQSLCALEQPDIGLLLAGNLGGVPIKETRNLLRRANRSITSRREKVVVFMPTVFRTRFAKMAKALSKVGWTTILVTPDLGASIPEGCFGAVHRTTDLGRILSLISMYRPQVCHLSSWLGDNSLLTIMRENIAKTVFDPTDYGSGFITDELCSLDEAYQNECMRLADGICARDLRPRLMWRDLKIARPKRVLHFPDYCWNEEKYSFLSSERLDGIHLVSAGGLVCSDTPDNLDYGYTILAEKLAKAGVHLHVYPSEASERSGTFDRDYGPLIALSKNCEFLHMYPSTRSENVPEALSRYHFGVHFYLPILQNRPLRKFTYSSTYLSGPARLADYLDAGLFLLCESDLKYSRGMFERKGILNSIDLQFLENPLPVLKDKLAQVPFEKIAELRNNYSTDAHVNRLTRFYESL